MFRFLCRASKRKFSMSGSRRLWVTSQLQQTSSARSIRSGGRMKGVPEWNSDSSWARITSCSTRSFAPPHSLVPTLTGSYHLNSLLLSTCSTRAASSPRATTSAFSEISAWRLVSRHNAGGTISCEFGPSSLTASSAGRISPRSAIRSCSTASATLFSEYSSFLTITTARKFCLSMSRTLGRSKKSG